MTSDDEVPLRLAIHISDDQLSSRLAAILESVAGLELVSGDSGLADAVVVTAVELPPGAAADVKLTPRELEVLALLAEGASNKQIARRLAISAHTAKFHVGQVIDKLDAVSRTDAVAHAARLGVIHL